MTSDKATKLAFLLHADDRMSAVLAKAAANANGSFSKIEQKIGEFGQKFSGFGVQFKALGEKISKPAIDMANDWLDTTLCKDAWKKSY